MFNCNTTGIPQGIRLTLRSRFGQRAVYLLNSLFRLQAKLARTRCRITFLKHCRNHQLVPAFIRNSVAPSFTQSGTYLHKKVSCSFRFFLKAALKDAYVHENELKRTISTSLEDLLSLAPDLSQEINSGSATVYRRTFTAASATVDKKFHSLYYGKYGRFPVGSIWPDKNFRDSVVVNSSTSVFSDAELDILALGPKFCLPAKKVPVVELLAPIERALTRTTSNVVEPVDCTRSKVSNLLLSNSKSRTVPSDVQNHVKTVVSDLQKKAKEEELIYVSADKGSKTVILPKSTYFSKMSGHFQNTALFSKTNKTKIKFAYSTVKSLLATFLSSATIMSLLPSFDRSVVPKPYALVKVHKPGLPIRVITPTRHSMFYSLSQKLDLVLKPSVSALQYRIGSVVDFVSELRSLSLTPSSFFVSLDVVSLFDNVDTFHFISNLPSLLANTAVVWRNSVPLFSACPINSLVSLFQHILNNSSVSFDNSLLFQKFGVPMGSPCSVSVSDIYLGLLEEEFLNNVCPSFLKPCFYRRYIDDILVLFEFKPPFLSKRSIVDSFVSEFHHFLRDTKLRFTVEFELALNNSISFLDCNITRLSESVEVTVYRKPTHSNRYISKYSFIPNQFLSSTLKTLQLRAMRYCTNYTLLQAEFDFLYDIFVNKHGYSSRLISKFFDFNRIKSTCSLPPPPKSRLPSIVLSFHGPVSIALKRILSAAGYPVYFRSALSLRSLLFYKNTAKTNKLEKNNVCYLLTCDSCPCFYIGMTTRCFKSRFNEHVSSVNSRASCDNVSAITQHSRTSGHSFSFNKFLCVEDNYHSLLFKEAFYISANTSNPNLLNIKCVETSSLISNLYQPLLSSCKL